jgi:predicted nucleotide-binding protein (sugar kinase/HSP70/actin superfamily)
VQMNINVPVITFDTDGRKNEQIAHVTLDNNIICVNAVFVGAVSDFTTRMAFNFQTYRIVEDSLDGNEKGLKDASDFFNDAALYSLSRDVYEKAEASESLREVIKGAFAGEKVIADQEYRYDNFSNEQIVSLVNEHTGMRVNPNDLVLMNMLDQLMNYEEFIIAQEQNVKGIHYKTVRVNSSALRNELKRSPDNDAGTLEAIDEITENGVKGADYDIVSGEFGHVDTIAAFNRWIN